MKRSKLLLSVLAASLCLTACSANAPAEKKDEPTVTDNNEVDSNNDSASEDETSSEKADNVLRVMTVNFMAKASHDPKKQAEWVTSFEPDVVAAQEVDRFTQRNNLDVPKTFAEGGAFADYFFSEQMEFQGGEYGLAMFTTSEIKNEETINIYSDDYLEDEELRQRQRELFAGMDSADPQTSADYDAFCDELKEIGKTSIEPNIIQKIEIEKDGKLVSVYGVHLSYEMEEIRIKQREQLLQMLEEDTNEYFIVVGDFNADQGTCELNDFVTNDKFNLANGNDGVWHDTFPIGDDENMKTYSIDNIITSSNIEITNVHYEDTELSDHTMLYADLILK